MVAWLLWLARDPGTLGAICVILGFAARLYGINLVVTSDEGYWLQRTVRFNQAMMEGRLAETYRSGHPGVTVMWTGLLGMGPQRAWQFAGSHSLSAAILEETPGADGLMASARTAIAIVATALFALAAMLAWRLLGPPGALGGLLLALDPYTIGMTRLLHVDALLTPLMLVSALAGQIYWLQGRQWPYLAVSAAAGGLALLTKAPAVILLPYLGLVWLVVTRPWRSLAAWRGALAWGLTFAAVYIVLWPALWMDLLGRVQQVARFAVVLGGGPHNWPNFFLGQPTTDDPGVLFYPVAIAFRLGPVAAVGLLALVALVLAQRPVGGSTVLWMAAFVIVFMDVMAIGAKKFDRYMLPALGMLTILGGVGIWSAARLLSGRLATSLVALAVLAQGAWLAVSYPYPIAAYNPLLGGVGVARQAIMLGWGEGLDQVAQYLNSRPDRTRLVVSTQYHHVLRLQFQGETIRVPSPRQLDYFVVYVNMAQRNTIPPRVQQAMATTPAEFTAMVDGVPYAWVYRGPWLLDSSREVPVDVEEEVETQSEAP